MHGFINLCMWTDMPSYDKQGIYTTVDFYFVKMLQLYTSTYLIINTRRLVHVKSIDEKPLLYNNMAYVMYGL